MPETDQNLPDRASSPMLDLFGDPLPANWGKPGRPEHVPTQHNRNRVAMMLVMGWSNSRIAAAMYITEPTLRKHYRGELNFRDVARDRLNATLANKLWELFMSGNVAAGKEFRDLVEKNDLMLYGQSAPPEKPTKEPKLGKKEMALAAAQEPDAGSPLGNLMARRQSLN